MDPDTLPQSVPAGKKRIPKACSSCRQSKVRCDGDKPCSRCLASGKQCVFFEVPKDPCLERLEILEREVRHLNEEMASIQTSLHNSRSTGADIHTAGAQVSTQTQRSEYCIEPSSQPTLPTPFDSRISRTAGIDPPELAREQNHVSIQSLVHPGTGSSSSRKRSHSVFELQNEPIMDVITKGLVPVERAGSYFETFFQGCDRYIPIFDPRCDTFTSTRSRSVILFNAICTIGCRVANESNSSMSDILNAELKRSINAVILNPKVNCLESVQAMLVVACYSAERSLILSFATRMALDLKLPDAYEELIQTLAMRGSEASHSEEEYDYRWLMRKSRTWFGLLVLEHIYRVDAGKLPGILPKGNANRCRLLLSHPLSTALDLRLLSQVELNVLRAKLNDSLTASTETPGEFNVVEFVRDAKIDIGLWFTDWSRMIESSTIAGAERPFLMINLRVQKCWAEMMVQCRAMRYFGVENVAMMSSTERDILLMAKNNAKHHLRLITSDPEHYLSTLKYAMDFVWAKCAFCFLLLLKLSQLVPESEEDSQQLLDRGHKLLHELSRGGNNGNSGTGNNNIYLQILKLSIEKFGRALSQHGSETAGEGTSGTPSAAMGPFWESFSAQTDLQSFVPEQFIFEWDFPGLNLFYFPTTWQDFFDDLVLSI